MVDIVQGEPITLPDGTVILPAANSAGSVIVMPDTDEGEDNEEVLSNNDAFNEELMMLQNSAAPVVVRRSFADIPCPISQMNLIVLVYSYTTWGLEDLALCRLLGINEQQLNIVRSSEHYNTFSEQAVDAFRKSQQTVVAGYISEKAKHAAVTMAHMLKANDTKVRVVAAKDLLDRAGYKDAEELHVKSDSEIRIRIIDEEPPINTDVDYGL